MAAGVDVRFVENMARSKNFVQCSGAGLESKVVLIAAIEINLQTGEIHGLGECQRTVFLPEHGIGWGAENSAEHPRADAAALRRRNECRQFVDDGRAVRADRREKFGMAKGQMQSAVAAHGNSGNATIGAACAGAIARFNSWQEFLHQKIFVARLAVARINVKTCAGTWRGN